MMRALVVSHLDLDREPNQRTQHMLCMLASHCSEVVVVYSVRAAGSGIAGMLHDALRHAVHLRQDGVVRYVRVHPWLNYAQAVAHALDDGMPAGPGRQAGSAQVRRLLADVLSAVGALRDVAWLPSMRAAARRHATGCFDIALADAPWAGLVARTLQREGRVDRLVYDDMDHVGGGQRLAWRRRWIERIEKRLVAEADIVVCVGPELAALREAATGRQPAVLPNGADLARFAPPPVRPAHPPTALYMGRLEAARGVDLAIDAMAAVRQVLPQACLLVLGDGDAAYVARLQTRIAALNLQQTVKLLGPVPHAQLPRYLCRADVGIATFRLSEQGRYAMPLKVAEYMAAGVPVVCTEGTAAAGWVQRSGAGLATAFDAAALAKALLTLLQDPERRAAAAAAGLAASQELAWSRITERMWQLMQPAEASA